MYYDQQYQIRIKDLQYKLGGLCILLIIFNTKMKKIMLLMVILLIVSVKTYDCVERDDGTLGGQNCEAEGGDCVDILQGLLDRPVCLLFKGCRYDVDRKGCLDRFSFCSKKGGCCLPVAREIKSGRPICQCMNNSSSIKKCPYCLAQVGTDICIDQNKVCTQRRGCCGLQKWPSPILDKYWDVCECRGINNNQETCQTCFFNKEKAACVDKNDECRKSGKCCRIKPNQFSEVTGLPVCECVKSLKCPQCQRTQVGGECFDPTNTCKQNNLCCDLDKFQNGVQFCHCHGCPIQDICKYDRSSKTCNGNCKNAKDCCQFSGKFVIDANGNKEPYCLCKEALNAQFCRNSCQWNKDLEKCYDTTGRCDFQIGKCCRLDESGTLCGCRDCLSTGQKCRYNQRTLKCESLTCPNDGKHSCIKKVVLINGVKQTICQCVEIRLGDQIFFESPAEETKNLVISPFEP